MSSVVRRFTFCAAHRLMNHGGKCRRLHGHNYVAEVTVRGPIDGYSGMVVDFGDLKSSIGEWIDLYWDHRTILNGNDPLLAAMHELFPHGDVYKLIGEPTAENMARILLALVQTRMDERNLPGQTCSVRLWETENCSAEAF